MGRSSCASQAASWMQFFIDGGKGIWASGWFGLIAATYRRTQKDSGLADISGKNAGHQKGKHSTKWNLDKPSTPLDDVSVHWPVFHADLFRLNIQSLIYHDITLQGLMAQKMTRSTEMEGRMQSVCTVRQVRVMVFYVHPVSLCSTNKCALIL